MTGRAIARARGALVAILLGAAFCGPLGDPPRAAAAPPVVVNHLTGLAISGFDPVAYFTEHKPALGRPGLELSLGGAVWQFRNEGNRAAFAANPEVYMPRFGGFDPVAVARGETVPGHPLIWTILGERLYLFYDDAARKTFLADPGRILVTAERRWKSIVSGLGQ
ncbi:MAG TPA: YHS domain-containing (seleno)protein [Pseudolabrys sp.]|nr:YHS domain-containing (seleno)protein [Pseudolabrys sp.]